MPILLRNDIKSAYVKNLEINGDKVEKIVLDSNVIKKGALFYKGLLGNMISFDHNTTLPSFDEATSYIEQQVSAKQENAETISCIYVDVDNMKFDKKVSMKVFKQLRKEYKLRERRNNR